MVNHFAYWPKRLSTSLSIPETTLYDNLVVAAKRYPHNEAVYYYGASYTYQQLLEEVDKVAGFLQHTLHVKKGDRVLLYMQNSPQFVISYFAILRANAVVVPINTMNTTEELAFYMTDCSMKHAIVGQELWPRVKPFLHSHLEAAIVGAYSHYLPEKPDFEDLPKEVAMAAIPFNEKGVYTWGNVLQAGCLPKKDEGSPDDLAVLPYTSGTTGLPKGCMHTHRTVQANVIGGYHWINITSNSLSLQTLPLFHVTGMTNSMLVPIYAGASMVIMTRWNREYAKQIIQTNNVTHWVTISTMLIDFLSNKQLLKEDLRSLVNITGGGAPLPEAVGQKLFQLTGIQFLEGYGLSETIAQTHLNPPDHTKLQCLGIPVFDVDARVIDPISLKELGDNEEGEIIVRGPQVFKGYYNRPDETKYSFIELDGKSFFRTGDIGRQDQEGYYFMVDRVKRMINASGFKVWPSEVENTLYKHPAIQQACVIGAPDAHRGETVKAFVILQEEAKGNVTEDDIIEWAKNQMAAYKYPRIVEFRDALPTTSSGKILWRQLQEEETKDEVTY
ncbi:long-chain fatty acid--CoA ligase [Priestia koreensis]|uniref:Long-chain fatty acid--CoA ligase n=1 Tax=Priestia koreensis TaxID=284581 RepID=A0A0M0KW92_9BACI|nr:long-chain fatty acid--CoA ligase [Priestia koreensis]KOO42892.1 long-chain fatty acid--CoA ligase [Priestia koreensis]